jgi:hypothetical protein
VIADFRLSFTETTLNNPEESDDLFPKYENYNGWPFEVFLLSQEPNEDPTNLAQQFATMTKLPIPQEISNYDTKNPETLKSSYKTWDVYAVNQLIYTFMTENQIPIDEIPFMKDYKDLLYSYLTSPPSQRLTIPALQENIRNIFKSVPKEEHLTFIKLLTMANILQK